MNHKRKFYLVLGLLNIFLLFIMSAIFKKGLEQNTNFSNINVRTDSETEIRSVFSNKTEANRLPQIIGIGSRKCSTGALMAYLCSHPQVQCPNDELHFFDHLNSYEKGMEYYSSLFPPPTSGSLSFEKTPRYFVIKSVPKRIKFMYENANSDVKFVLSLCDPALRAYSDYVNRLKNDLNYNKFDDYIAQELPKLKTFLSQNTSEWLETSSNEEYEAFITNNWRFIFRGIYSFHLQRWFKNYSPDKLLVIDGDVLTTQPWNEMKKVQEFANLPVLLKRNNFLLNDRTGFYCLKQTQNMSRVVCMGKSKGRTRSFNFLSKTIRSRISDKSRKLLNDFYRPYNKQLKQLLPTADFEWMKSAT